ncbi:MAG TPA: LacI family DNA-binding transcriptional regulator [Flexivirga sp.]|uniref:LacI family DNA-binding transcriptional regulator n=1 Tax=Flexivirga sp. TaxID=1962927 RepID=UPI002B90222A|nr:LacI family DNA-binding transcriptional regulator [Flexivirga sp.]HWC24387.1 LacI family DNA-binding transcriptional regulator [Flexivirga sp.]
MAAKHRGKPATAQDVADLAETSRTAVSFVLNGKEDGNVSAATRERILRAAAELNYSPHPGARSLRTQRTHLIGVITDSIASSPFAGQLLDGASQLARRHGFLVAVYDTGGHADRELEGAQEFRRRRVDGLIYASMGLRQISDVLAVGLPTVLANCFAPDTDLPSVIPAEREAGAAAAAVLLDHGHRAIATINGDTAIAGPLRHEGFVGHLAEHDCVPEVQSLGGRDWTIDEGFRAATALLNRPPADRPTAIFCVTDRVAAGALLAATRLGLGIPDDVSILGFDDQEELAANLVPALTTFALPHRQMGEAAVAMLIDQLAGVTLSSRPTLLPSPLVLRESVAAPPRRR